VLSWLCRPSCRIGCVVPHLHTCRHSVAMDFVKFVNDKWANNPRQMSPEVRCHVFVSLRLRSFAVAPCVCLNSIRFHPKLCLTMLQGAGMFLAAPEKRILWRLTHPEVSPQWIILLMVLVFPVFQGGTSFQHERSSD
jgi:hypothetical protein